MDGDGSLMFSEVSPTARIVAAAMATVSVKDVSGRVLEVRRPGALDRLRLFKALGPGLSSNEQYVGYSMLAMCVVSIDGVPVPQPGNEAQMEGLIGRLGDEGMVAVGQGLLDQAGNIHAGGVADAGGGNGEARPG